MTRFAVVQDLFELEDWPAAAEALTAVLGLHPTMAKRQARQSHGYLAEELDLVQAQRIQHACRSRGIALRIVAEPDLVVLPKPTRVHQLWLKDDALWVCRSEAGPPQAIGWDGIVQIAAFLTTKTETFHHWSTSHDSYAPGFAKQMQTAPKLSVSKESKEYAEHLADVMVWPRDGTIERVRLRSREINYQQALGADAADPHLMQDARTQSFRLLLTRIHTRAPRAYVPPETVALLGGEPDQSRPLYQLRDLADFDGYNRWLLQRLRLDTPPATPEQLR